MKKLSTFLLFIFFSTLIFSQTGSIRGFVYDKKTGEPIIFTNVYLLNTSHGSSTDVNGYFVISKIPKGDFTLKISSLGYEEKTIPVKIKPNDILSLKIELEPASKMLSAVEISAERQASRTESQVSIEKITSKDITQMPAIGGTADLAQYMQVLPGVVFTGDQGGQLYIRGGSAIQNKVLLDGMVIFNPFHSIGLFSVFETDIIRNADIFTGGFGAKYGGRLSSVMDITTRDGNKKTTQGKFGASTFGANILLEGPIFKEDTSRSFTLSYLLTAKNSYLSYSSKKIYSYIDGSLPYDFLDLYGKLTLAADNGSKLNLFGFNFTDKVNKYKSIANFDWSNKGVGGNFIILPGNSSALIEAVFAYSDYTVNMEETTTGDKKTSNIGGFNVGITTTNYYGKDQFKFGLEMLGNTTKTKVNSLEQTDYSTELGAFAIYKGIWGKLVYEPSFRLSYYASIGEVSPEPRLALKYNITDSWRIKAATGLYSQSFIDTKSDRDIVNLFTGYLTIAPDGMNIVRSFRGEELNSYLQKSTHFIFGTEIDLTRTLTLNIEGYYKTMNNLVSLNRYKDDLEHLEYGENPVPDYFTKDYAVENGKAYGMDISLKYDDDRLYIWTVYSLGKVTREDELVEYSPHYDRRHNVNVLLSYQMGLDRSWEVSLRWNYGSGFPYTPTAGAQELLDFQSGINFDYVHSNGELKQIYGQYNSKRLPEYHRLDFSAKKKFSLGKRTLLELNLSVTNIYNRENMFYYDRVSGQRVDQLPIMPSFGMLLTF